MNARRLPIMDLPAVEAVPTIDATAVVEPLLRAYVAGAPEQLLEYNAHSQSHLRCNGPGRV